MRKIAEFVIDDRFVYTEWEDREYDCRKNYHDVFDKETNETYMLDVSPYRSLSEDTVKKIIALNFPDRKAIDSNAPLRPEDIDRLYSEMNS